MTKRRRRRLRGHACQAPLLAHATSSTDCRSALVKCLTRRNFPPSLSLNLQIILALLHCVCYTHTKSFLHFRSNSSLSHLVAYNSSRLQSTRVIRNITYRLHVNTNTRGKPMFPRSVQFKGVMPAASPTRPDAEGRVAALGHLETQHLQPQPAAVALPLYQRFLDHMGLRGPPTNTTTTGSPTPANFSCDRSPCADGLDSLDHCNSSSSSSYGGASSRDSSPATSPVSRVPLVFGSVSVSSSSSSSPGGSRARGAPSPAQQRASNATEKEALLLMLFLEV